MKDAPASLYDFLVKHLGPNWVVARRTKRIIQKYGAETPCISQKRYNALCREYETLACATE